MKEPTYKPEQWIVYEQDGAGGFGQIIGGIFDGESWLYTVSGVSVDSEYVQVEQDEITHLLQNGSWLAPSHFGGHTSVYSEPEA